MRKGICILAILAIIVIGWSQTANASLIEPLGEVVYNDYLQVDIEYPSEIDLVYVYSSISEDALDVSKLTYIPETNMTRYLFTSELYFPKYWEQLNNEMFIFQDYNSKQLYMIQVNMSNIEIPEDPWKVKYLNTSEMYTDMYFEYNETGTNLTKARSELEDLIIKYTNASDELNVTKEDRENLFNTLTNKSVELNQMESDLNNTRIKLDEANSNVTIYSRFYKEMTSYKTRFDFTLAGQTEQFSTIYKYESDINKLEKQVAGFPLLIFFFVLITVVVCLMLGYWRWARNRSTPEELEVLQGVDETTSKVNTFKSRLGFKPKNVKLKEKELEENKPDETKPKEGFEDLRKEVDDKIKQIETKVDKSHTDIMAKLDSLFESKKPTPDAVKGG